MSGPGKAAGISGRSEVSLGARGVLLAVLALILMIVDHHQDHLTRVRELLSLALYPLNVAVDLPYRTWHSLSEAVADRGDLLQENTDLKRRLTIAEYRLQNLTALELENDRLRDLLDTSSELGEDRVLVAEIMAVDLEYRQRIVINRGSVDDVCVGQPLLDAGGVVGQVERVSPMTSEALLITGVDHAIPVAIERNGLRTTAHGSGDSGELRLPFLTNNADVEVGDRLVTSGLGGIFPAGRPVGIIKSIEQRPNESFAEVTARPVASLDRDQEVLLVWNESSGGCPDQVTQVVMP